MRWVFAVVLVVVAGVVSSLSLYAFVLRDQDGDQRDEARVIAEEWTNQICPQGCHLIGVEKRSRGVWRAVYARSGRSNICVHVHPGERTVISVPCP